MSKEYGELSTMFYELTKPVGFSVDGDIEYYAEKLKNLTGRILEAGVGTGRMLIPLAQSGLVVDGVDNSREMLAQCKINVKNHGVSAKLLNRDLMRLALPDKYDAIIIPTGSFCLLPKVKASDVLTSFYRSLNDGGRVIIDLERMPANFTSGETKTREVSVAPDTKILLATKSGTQDTAAQKTTYTQNYELIRGRKVIKTETADFVLYWYETAEFETLLAQAGFVDIKKEIGYGKTGQSDIVTVSAVKRQLG